MSTESSVPLIERTPADYGWTEPTRVHLWDPLLDNGARVTFGNVVSAHQLATSRERDPEVREEARLLKRHLRAKFEQQVGPIQNSFFCGRVRGGVAIVERTTPTGPSRELHTVLNSSVASLVALEAECHALAHQTRDAFCGTPAALDQQRLLTDAVYSAMTRVLSAADLAAQATDLDGVDAAVATARAEVAHVSTRVHTAIQRQARFVYFQGALIGSVVTLAVCVVLGLLSARFWAGNVNTPALVAAMLFGALGAVVSVFQRISTGGLVLDFNASRGQLRWLGALRPAVGAVFGTVAQFALATGLLGTTNVPTATSFGVFAIIGFAAGFTERFATDMVERAGQMLAIAEPQPPPAHATVDPIEKPLPPNGDQLSTK
jgi:hypothetical protein